MQTVLPSYILIFFHWQYFFIIEFNFSLPEISWHISLFSVSAKLLSENTFLASMMSNNFNFGKYPPHEPILIIF